jgi:hypothetical protein
LETKFAKISDLHWTNLVFENKKTILIKLLTFTKVEEFDAMDPCDIIEVFTDRFWESRGMPKASRPFVAAVRL